MKVITLGATGENEPVQDSSLVMAIWISNENCFIAINTLIELDFVD